jgi:hypothetical protein
MSLPTNELYVFGSTTPRTMFLLAGKSPSLLWKPRDLTATSLCSGALIPDDSNTSPVTQHVTLVGDARPDIPPQIKVKYWFDLTSRGTKVTMDDFHIERVIGKGSFGKVGGMARLSSRDWARLKEVG